MNSEGSQKPSGVNLPCTQCGSYSEEVRRCGLVRHTPPHTALPLPPTTSVFAKIDSPSLRIFHTTAACVVLIEIQLASSVPLTGVRECVSVCVH